MRAAQILKDVILRPGAMHITMSFLGFIGTLMKGSSLDTLVGSAFGGLTGIMSGKVRAMRAFRMVSAALMRTILMISWHTLKMRGNTRQEGTGWITFWCQRTWLISFFGQRKRETGSSNSCALNACYYTSSVRVTSIRTMLAISPCTWWRCGTFYPTLPRPTSLPEQMSVTIVTP